MRLHGCDAGDKVLSTTLAVLPGGAGAPATALQALERAAAAAATPLAYQPGELLQLIAEHLRASGLAASADTLTGEAGLTPSPAGSTGASCGFAAATTAATAAQRGAAKDAAQGAAQFADTSSPVGVDSTAADSAAPPSAKRRRLSVAPKLQMALAGCSGGRASSLPPPSSRGPELQRASELSQQRRASASATPAGADRAASGDDASWLSRLSSPAATPDACAAAASAPASVSVGSLLKGLPRRGRPQHVRTGSSLRTPGTASHQPVCGSLSADTPATATAAPTAAATAAALPVTADHSPAEGSPAESRLHSMVMAHLRAQHEAACAAAANPISTLAPISLLEPHVLPEVTGGAELPDVLDGMLDAGGVETV